MSQKVGLFPVGNSMDGIFRYLKLNDGDYFSRYQIKASLTEGNVLILCSFHTNKYNDVIVTSYSDQNVTFRFNFSFYLTDYSLSNSGGGHTFPTGWNLLGKNENSVLRLADSRREQKFCDTNSCSESIVKTYHLKKPMKMNEIVFNTLSTIGGRLVVRSIEFFGVFCLSGANCVFSNNANRYPRISRFVFVLLFLLCS